MQVHTLTMTRCEAADSAPLTTSIPIKSLEMEIASIVLFSMRLWVCDLHWGYSLSLRSTSIWQAWRGNKVRPVPVAERIAAVIYTDFLELLVNGIVWRRVEDYELKLTPSSERTVPRWLSCQLRLRERVLLLCRETEDLQLCSVSVNCCPSDGSPELSRSVIKIVHCQNVEIVKLPTTALQHSRHWGSEGPCTQADR